MSASKEDLDYLLYWAINDGDFMDGLLKAPQGKARKLGMKLSKKQVEFFKAHAKTIRGMNKLAEDALTIVKRSRVATIIGTEPN